MKKYLKFIIILLVLIILSTVIYIAVDSKKDAEEKNKESQGIVNLFEFNISDITNMSVTCEGETYDFRYEDGQWGWNDEENAPFECSTSTLKIISNVMSQLKSTKIVVQNPENPENYGFDGSMEISCLTSDGKENKIELGSKNPTNDSYYVRTNGENTVYTISLSEGQNLRIYKDYLKNSYLFNVSSSAISKIYVERSGEVIFDLQKDDNGVWQINEPFIGMDVDLAKVSSYINLIIRANAAAFVDENPSDLSKYGLDNPSYILRLSAYDNDTEIIFGNEAEEYKGGIYTMIKTAKSEEVMVFYKSNIGIIEADTLDIIKPLIYNTKINNVSEVDISIDGQKTVLTIDSEAEKYSFNETEVADEERIKLFKEFFTSFNMLEVSGTQKECNSDTSQIPEMEINYKLKNGSEILTSYYKDEENDFYYLFNNGKYTGTVVSENNIKSIKATYSGILNRIAEEKIFD